MFWGEPDATVHFGEPKYEFSSHVAEMGNTLTSLCYVEAVLRTCYRETRLPRVHELALMLVGVTSALFHASGRRWAQLMDEGSMLLWTSSVLWSVNRFTPRLRCATALLWIVYLFQGHFGWFFLLFTFHVLTLLRTIWSLKLTSRLPPVELECCLGSWTYEADGPGMCSAVFGLATLSWVAEQLYPKFFLGHMFWHCLSAGAACMVHDIVARARVPWRDRTRSLF